MGSGDFNVYANNAASTKSRDLVTSMVALGLSQIVSVSTQVGHTLDFIFGMGINVDLGTADAVPWSDHFALKAALNIPRPSCLGVERIYSSVETNET